MKRKLWDRMAKSYDKRFWKLYQPIISLLKSLMGAQDEILEMGSGSGLISFELIPFIKKFIGVDLSESMVEVANQKLLESNIRNATFIVGDGQNLTIMEQFTKIILINLIHVIESPHKLMDQLSKISTPSSEIIVLSFCHGEKMQFKFKILSSLMRIGSILGLIDNVIPFTFESLRNLVLSNGFILKKEFIETKGFPYICFILKTS